MSEPARPLASLPIFDADIRTSNQADPARLGKPTNASSTSRSKAASGLKRPLVRSTISSEDERVPAAEPSAAADLPGRHKDIDWTLVRELRLEVARRRSDRYQTGGPQSQAEERRLGTEIISDLVQKYADGQLASHGTSFDREQQSRLEQAVSDAVFGMGRLQPLVDDPDIENIELFGADGVVLEYADGRVVNSGPVADSDEELVEDLNYLAASGLNGNAREFSSASPQLHMRLPGGSRLAASMGVSPRPLVTIRRHRLRQVRLADLVERSMMTDEVAELLRASVAAQKTIMISGPQGGGKTTLLRACCAAMDPWENIGTIESEYELHLHELPEQHRRIRAWEARPGTGEYGADGRRAGEVTLDDLTESVWRHNLDRLVLGEVRGREAAALMKIISGIQGAMWTVHAPNARAAIERMVTLMMEAGPHITVDFARRQVTAHVDLIVQIGVSVAKSTEGSPQRLRKRFVSEIVAVEEGEAGIAATTEIFTARDPAVGAQPENPLPPKLLRSLREFGDYRPLQSQAHEGVQ